MCVELGLPPPKIKNTFYHCRDFLFNPDNKRTQYAGGHSGKVSVGEFKRVERRIAPVVPQQLVFQEAQRLQREHQPLVLQKAVHVQT